MSDIGNKWFGNPFKKSVSSMWTLLHISMQVKFIRNKIRLRKNLVQFSMTKPLPKFQAGMVPQLQAEYCSSQNMMGYPAALSEGQYGVSPWPGQNGILPLAQTSFGWSYWEIYFINFLILDFTTGYALWNLLLVLQWLNLIIPNFDIVVWLQSIRQISSPVTPVINHACHRIR